MTRTPQREAAPLPRLRENVVRLVILALCALATQVQGQTTQPTSADRFAAVRESLQRWMDSTGAPSIAVAVAKDGRIVWEEAFGWANREKGIRATPHTMYSLASITKPFTATGLMILAERGQISLDSPANAYLGSGKLRARVGWADDATVRRVLSNTAGLPFHFQFFYAGGGYAPPSMDETIARYGNLVFAPGSQYEYSNLGFGVLDHIIARTSGKSYAEFMRQEVFLPLGLHHTAVIQEAPNSDSYAERYDHRRRPIPFYTFDHFGASAIYASVHDLVRFGMFHLKNHLPDQQAILRDETIDLMHEAVPPAASYGLGFSIKPNDFGYRRVFHGGSMPGVNNMLRLYPAENVAFALLTNVELNFGGLLDDIAAALIPQFADTLRRDRASAATRPASPPNPAFTPPASLVGDWMGAIHTWDGSLDLALRIRPDGVVMASVGDQPVAQALRPRFQNGRFIAVIDGRIPTADAGRWPHSIVLNVVLDDHGALKGQASALTSGDVSYFALSSFAELRKR